MQYIAFFVTQVELAVSKTEIIAATLKIFGSVTCPI